MNFTLRYVFGSLLLLLLAGTEALKVDSLRADIVHSTVHVLQPAKSKDLSPSIRPEVVSTSPKDGSSEDFPSLIRIEFNERINYASSKWKKKQVSFSDGNTTIYFDSATVLGKTLIISTTSGFDDIDQTLETENAYTVKIPSKAISNNGENMAEDYSFSFSYSPPPPPESATAVESAAQKSLYLLLSDFRRGESVDQLERQLTNLNDLLSNEALDINWPDAYGDSILEDTRTQYDFRADLEECEEDMTSTFSDLYSMKDTFLKHAATLHDIDNVITDNKSAEANSATWFNTKKPIESDLDDLETRIDAAIASLRGLKAAVQEKETAMLSFRSGDPDPGPYVKVLTRDLIKRTWSGDDQWEWDGQCIVDAPKPRGGKKKNSENNKVKGQSEQEEAGGDSDNLPPESYGDGDGDGDGGDGMQGQEGKTPPQDSVVEASAAIKTSVANSLCSSKQLMCILTDTLSFLKS